MMDWQIQQMKEDADARKWEDMNRPVISENTAKEVCKNLNTAIDELDKSCDCVNEAMRLLDGTPLYEVMDSILSDLDEVLTDLKLKRREYERIAV